MAGAVEFLDNRDMLPPFRKNFKRVDFDVYSICYLEVIYTVSKTHPEAGALALCSLYMYQKKGTHTMEIGFPSVYNWIASIAIEDKESVDVLMIAQEKMEEILKDLTK